MTFFKVSYTKDQLKGLFPRPPGNNLPTKEIVSGQINQAERSIQSNISRPNQVDFPMGERLYEFTKNGWTSRQVPHGGHSAGTPTLV